MRDGDWLAGLVGVLIGGAVAVLVVLCERGLRWLGRRLFAPRRSAADNQRGAAREATPPGDITKGDA